MNNTQIMKILEDKFVSAVASLHMNKHYSFEEISKLTGETLKAKDIKLLRIYFPFENDDDIRKLWNAFRIACAPNTFLETVEKAFTRFACEALSEENLEKYFKKHKLNK